MPCGSQLIFCNVFPEAVQIPLIVQVFTEHHIRRKGLHGIELFLNPICQEDIAVIAGIPVEDVLYALRLWNPAFKMIVDLDQQFVQDRQIIGPALEGIGDPAAKLRIQEAEQLSHFFPEDGHGILRIGIAFFIMVRQDVRI